MHTAKQDVRNLLGVLQRLADGGNTVIVIEHHMDVMLNADHIIDLGLLGGYRGGNVVVYGTPEQVAKIPDSATGKMLVQWLKRAAEQRG